MCIMDEKNVYFETKMCIFFTLLLAAIGAKLIGPYGGFQVVKKAVI